MDKKNFKIFLPAQKSVINYSGYFVRRITPLLKFRQFIRHKLAVQTLWRLQYLAGSVKSHFQLKASEVQMAGNLSKPIVYSCSGCSSAAQMANYIALELNRSGIAEMSCIAGVGGNVSHLVETALSGRTIIAIDGCPLACSKACLVNHLVQPHRYFDLTEYGVRKKIHVGFSKPEAKTVIKKIVKELKTMSKKSNNELCTLSMN
jgi:uncharacterized metal-binding protein